MTNEDDQREIEGLRSEIEGLRNEIEQHNDQLQEQQKMLSAQTAQLRDLHTVSDLAAEAIFQLGIIANVGFAMSTNASGEARKRLVQIGGDLEKIAITKEHSHD
jgi:capsule polysaccharide export protein KpsE/RkpR